MSAKDDLERFEADWKRHLVWREGPRRGLMQANGEGPGKYVDASYQRGTIEVKLLELPATLRERVQADLNEAIRDLVDANKARVHADLKDRAIAEAKAVLAELEARS